MKNIKEDSLETLTNAMMFGGSEAIEMSEKKGQSKMVSNTYLPRVFNGVAWDKPKDTREWYESLGIKVRDCEDDLFYECELPSSILLEAREDTSYWSNLKRDGSVIGTIFYKAASYDRSAFINNEIKEEK